ncbi:MAG: RES family NAD+ phosphorylase [Acidimicrobiales bacterium]
MRSCPRRQIRGRFWHRGPTRWALVGITDPATTDGRYHERAGPGVWYASSQEQAAWAELFRHFIDEGVDPFEVRRRVGPADVHDLNALDLTDPNVHQILGVKADQLISYDLTLCHQIADAAHKAGFEGILAPAVALPGRTPLVVFGTGLVKLHPGVSRIASPPPRLADLLRLIRPHADVPAGVRALLVSLYRSDPPEATEHIDQRPPSHNQRNS